MRLTVLGCHSPVPPPGGACPGYLLEHGGTHVLLDCGNGVLAQLARHLDYNALDAVVVSHHHADHIADLLVLRYAAAGDRALGVRHSPLVVHACGEPVEEWERLRFLDAVDLRALGPDDDLAIGGLSFRFAAVNHSLPGLAISVEADGRRLVYSGDTAPCAAVVGLAAGADVFLCEASALRPEDMPPGVGHCTAGDAGRMAREAGAGRLVITHLHPRLDPARLAAAASDAFGRPAEAAFEGAVLTV